ncbi:glycosyltransferase [Apibacter muscae]|uniref:Glycosyltransferase n=1 Tax=Apibacter muscae TaxID=2509004 RepID=A0A563DGK8_9FLAO|nr:glycosyltransferase [Apibacter muscae]TWP29416.1 glycosyltransferase [Apibacter muscae]
MRSFYACLDAFPSSKGASTHIYHTLQELASISNCTDVFCLKGSETKELKLPDSVNVYSFSSGNKKDNYLKRAYLFSEKVFECMENIQEPGIGQFRDIWSGLAMINRSNIKTIFEVNALTSIELPIRYPLLTENVIHEINKIEQLCLDSCHHIVTPSYLTKNYLIDNFSIPVDKISVIPNGAEILNKKEYVDHLPEKYLVYFGALQPWQGLDILLKSLYYLQDYPDLKLVICSSVKEKYAKEYLKLCNHLNLKNKVIFLYELEKEKLNYVVSNAIASVAPLKFGERNIVQGCCPIKILESMANQSPLVVSDLPVTRELLNDSEAYFFEPEDELDLSRCIRFILENPEETQEKINQAYIKLKNQFTWEHHNQKLLPIYQSLL